METLDPSHDAPRRSATRSQRMGSLPVHVPRSVLTRATRVAEALNLAETSSRYAFSSPPQGGKSRGIVKRMSRPTSKLWAGVVLLGLATITADGFLPHTDDGCAIEVHCLACTASIGQAAVAAPRVALPAPGWVVEWIHTEAPQAVPAADSPANTSRGPPLG
jgi:hypothetical protein